MNCSIRDTRPPSSAVCPTRMRAHAFATRLLQACAADFALWHLVTQAERQLPATGDAAASAAPRRSRGSGGLDGLVDDEAEPSRVGVLLVARHEVVLRARRLQGDQQPHLVAAH